VSEDDEVIAPGGPRPRSSVHQVAPGQAVRRTAEGTYVVEDGGAAEEHVLTPGGLRPKSLVHTVEPGHTVDVAHGRLRVMHPSGEVVADLGALPLRPAGRPLMPRNVVAPPAPEEVVPA